MSTITTLVISAMESMFCFSFIAWDAPALVGNAVSAEKKIHFQFSYP